MNDQELLAFQLQLAALDSLELACVFFDQKFQAKFLSSRAAQALYITNRHEIGQYTSILAPLCKVAQTLAERNPAGRPQLEGTRRVQAVNIEELDVVTADARALPVLAFAKRLELGGPAASPVAGYMVVFHDLSVLEPFFRAIEQSRKSRTLLILTASVLGKPISLEGTRGETDRVYRSAEAEFFRLLPSAFEAVVHADLLSAIRLAVDIVDPLIVPTAKVLVDVRTSALLTISRPNFLRVVAHLLVEATDFVGPFGRTSVRAGLVPADEKQPGGEHVAEITLRAERQTEVPLHASPLELYIYSRYMPIHYKVSMRVGGEDEQFRSDAASAPLWTLTVGGPGSVAPDTLSPNLRVAAFIARLCGLKIQLRRLAQDILEISARLPLAG